MAKYEPGVNGPISGRIGTVIGSSWKGIHYLKHRNRRRKTKSDKEKLSQNKFSIAHFWLQPLLDFLREGFKDSSSRSTGFNAAKSYLIKNAFEGTAPNFYINPALVKVSAGDLPLPADISAEKSGDKDIRFTWDNSNIDEYSLDNVMLLAYDIENGNEFSKTIGEFRYKGTDTLVVQSGANYHLYLAFNAADRTRQSDSVYLGEMRM